MRELSAAGSQQTVSAETALAKGVTAQQKGTIGEALAYYYDAVSFDASLSEANKRLSVLSSDISSGNIGANVRNDIQLRKAWLEMLDQCEAFYRTHSPYEIVYHTTLTKGKINYQREIADLSCVIKVLPAKNGFKMVNTILEGLEKTGKKEEWGLRLWPLFFSARGERSYIFVDRLYSESDEIYGRNGEDTTDGRMNNFELLAREAGKGTSIILNLVNDTGKTIATTKVDITNRVSRSHFLKWDETIYSNAAKTDAVFQVNANDITDNLTIKIISVNGVDIVQRPDYIRISTAK
jgi:hypothetical protein